MLANLLQHVIEETQTGGNFTLATSIQIYLYIYVGFLGSATDLCHSLAGKEELSNLVPILGGKGAVCFQSFLHQSTLILLQIDGLATQVLGQFHIGVSVANHEAARQIVLGIVQILAQHTGARLASGRIVFRETPVDEHFIEGDAFILEGLHHKVVHRPESVFREGRSTQSILISHHGKLKVELATDETQIAEHLRVELQLLVRIELIVNGWLDDKGSVSIYEQYFFHSISILLKASNKASFSSLVPMVIRKQSLHKATFVRLRTIMPSLTK